MQGPHFFLICLVHMIAALTDEEKKTIVDKHNFYRSRPDPSASDMKALRWDKTLEELATSYAAKCIWDHNPERGFRGENLFLMSGTSLDVELGLDDWHRERDYYNFTTDACEEGKMCGHYTQMVWADTERVGCGEKFCEKIEGPDFTESNMFLLVCNYEPPGNFQGEKPFKPGDPCSSCPSSHTCNDSLCIDESLEQEKTSTAGPEPTLSEFISGVTHSQLDKEPTESEPTPESTLSELTPEPTQSELTPEPAQSELPPEPTQSELVSESTLSLLTPESTQAELIPTPTQSELVPETTLSVQTPEPAQSELSPEPTQSELSSEPTQSEIMSDSTKSEMVSQATTSELDPKPTPSELLLLDSTQMSTEPLEVSTPQRKENSSPDVMVQTSVQPTSQVTSSPSQENLSTSVKPSIPMDSTPHAEKNGIDKAFSNDEPDAPTVKDAVIPVTVSVISTKPPRTTDMSVLVSKPKEKVVDTLVNQDQSKSKDTVQRPPKTLQKEKEKQKDINLTSLKWKKTSTSSMRWDYKLGLSGWTHFGRPVQGSHFGRAPKPCPYPCLSSQSTSPMVFPLYRTNHISPMGGYNKANQWVSKPQSNPSFKQLCKLFGHKRGVYSLYLPKAHQH